MVKIYLLNDYQAIDDALMDEFLTLLPSEMINKANAYVNKPNRLCYIAGKLMLQYAFNTLQLDVSLHRIKYTEFDRPYITGIDFNISHSGDYIIIIISDESLVGIDIEKVKPLSLDDFFENMFIKDEWHKISMHAQANNYTIFYEYWTAKEAVAKADGRGLSLALKDIVLNKNYAQIYDTRWYLSRLHFEEKYVIHVASSKNIKMPAIENITIAQLEKALLCS